MFDVAETLEVVDAVPVDIVVEDVVSEPLGIDVLESSTALWMPAATESGELLPSEWFSLLPQDMFKQEAVIVPTRQ